MAPIFVPPFDADIVRQTREALKMSRHAFAFKMGVNPRTLERWQQGRSKPNEQAAALIWLVRAHPDTLNRRSRWRLQLEFSTQQPACRNVADAAG